jgi:hypothetical protein
LINFKKRQTFGWVTSESVGWFGSLARGFERHSFCGCGVAYMGIMVPSKDRGELVAVKVNPFDRGEATRGRPCALSRHLLDHDDGEHAWDKTLEEMEDICDGTY